MYQVAINQVIGSTNVHVATVEFDSRKNLQQGVFVAIKGLIADGHQFIDMAIQKGAIAVICEVIPANIIPNITYIQVDDAQKALAFMASNLYDNPSQKLQLVGVTGTNGKTTVATLLYQLFTNCNYKSGLLSTVKIMIGNQEFEATHTTPNSLAINYHLSEMVKNGVTHCFMEVSSHGIHQQRTFGLQFAGGIFTNITHDHLDYHKTFAEYRNVKKSFFDGLSKSAFAITNIDDKNGNFMLQNCQAKKYTYAVKTVADYKAKILEKQFSGTLLSINQTEIWSKLIGEFNVYNLLAIYATADLLGLDKLQILTKISELESVSGRFQYTISTDKVTAIVDYAHTPDALKNVLETINDIRSGNENLITVVGCGGDRDKTKRPIMGNIASILSTKVIFTSDNPRSENPKTILEEIESGVAGEHYKKTITIEDRKQAIKTANTIANSGDIILIAGKGHETYQEIKGEKFHFSDLEEITHCFKTR